MRKLIATAVLVLALAVGAQAVDPLTATFTNALSDANGAQVDPGTVYQGTTLVLTNCQVLTAGGAPQNLSNIVVRLVSGIAGNTVTNIGTMVAGTNGTWSAITTVPALSSYYLQVDLNTNSPIYPKKLIATEPVL